MTLKLMVILADIRKWSVAAAVHALQQAVYAVEARLNAGIGGERTVFRPAWF